jgi:hypothetical protein
VRPPPSAREEQAVLGTLAYSVLFDYPLTLAELREGLLEVSADEETLRGWLDSPRLRAAIEERDGFLFPRGRGDLVATRRAREAASRRLLRGERRALDCLAGMPWVRMVALSGSLAHLNAEDDADLDVFLITRAGRVWLVTVALLVLARLLGFRERLCLNYVVSERRLAVAPADLFTANQIAGLRPLAGAAAYRRFLDENAFVFRYYPNLAPRSVPERAASRRGRWGRRLRRAVERLLDFGIAPALEALCHRAYAWHLRRRAAGWASPEQVRLEAECLKLHTTSHRASVMARYDTALRDAGCPAWDDAPQAETRVAAARVVPAAALPGGLAEPAAQRT